MTPSEDPAPHEDLPSAGEPCAHGDPPSSEDPDPAFPSSYDFAHAYEFGGGDGGRYGSGDEDDLPYPPPASAPMLPGAVAAALGLGSLAVVVLLLWITTPYPDSGPGGALRTVAGLWLLAHGADLERTGTLSGGEVPVGITPMLITVLPVWLLYRAAEHALDASRDDQPPGEMPEEGDESPPESDDEGTRQPALHIIGWLSGGYLAVGLAALLYTLDGPLPVAPLSALLALPAMTVAAASAGVWSALGRPRGPLPDVLQEALERRIPPRVRTVLTRPRLTGALRAGAAATAVLLAGGALLAACAIAWHGAEVGRAYVGFTDATPGRFATLLLAVALIPNAVVWGAAYAIGTGFSVGGGGTAGPLGSTGHPALPDFPLFAALPGEAPGGPVTWAALAVPPLAGVAVAVFTARWATGPGVVGGGARAERRPVRHWRETALTAALAALACGVATLLLAVLAGGPLGTDVLADFGPAPWLTGGAAAGWTALIGIPGALVVRWWRLRLRARGPRAAATGRAGVARPWHGGRGRRVRWAALRRASGGLMTAFEPAGTRAGRPED